MEQSDKSSTTTLLSLLQGHRHCRYPVKAYSAVSVDMYLVVAFISEPSPGSFIKQDARKPAKNRCHEEIKNEMLSKRIIGVSDPPCGTGKRSRSGASTLALLLVSTWMFCLLAWGEQPVSGWQEEVRKSVEARDWTAAMRVVDREIARAPRDMDLRARRARILTWLGSLADAEREYGEILAAVPNDADCWLGLANVYSRQNRTEDALRALERAVELDPKRADIHAAHARALIAAHHQPEAKMEFQRALQLDSTSREARAGLLSLREPAKHELRVGVDADLFNFTGANQGEGLSLASQWTPHWGTRVAGTFYDRGGTHAEKLTASVSTTSSRWGSLTLGGTTANDNGVIPEAEGFFECDHGWKLAGQSVPRGIEIVYGQHWYWYTTARILALSETTLFYLPHEWTWSLGLTGARSSFPGAGVEWRPSGTSKLTFPITRSEQRRLDGNVFFAAGTENFAVVDQIGQFSSQTYGGGLRFQLTASQDVTGYAAYQKRTQDRTQTSLGVSYGVRF